MIIHSSETIVKRIRFNKYFLRLVPRGHTDVIVTRKRVIVEEEIGFINRAKQSADIRFPHLAGIYIDEGRMKLWLFVLGCFIGLYGFLGLYGLSGLLRSIDQLLGLLLFLLVGSIGIIMYSLNREVAIVFSTAGMILIAEGNDVSYAKLKHTADIARRMQDNYLENHEQSKSSPPQFKHPAEIAVSTEDLYPETYQQNRSSLYWEDK